MQGQSRIGVMNHKRRFHVNRTGTDVLDAMERIDAVVLKGVEHDVGSWRDVRRIVPDASVTARTVVPPHQQDRSARDPNSTGRAFAGRIPSLEASNVTYGSTHCSTPGGLSVRWCPGTLPRSTGRCVTAFGWLLRRRSNTKSAGPSSTVWADTCSRICYLLLLEMPYGVVRDPSAVLHEPPAKVNSRDLVIRAPILGWL